MSLYKELEDVFKDDCVEIRGYTREEAEKLLEECGQSFIVDAIENMWDWWSENFPVEEKE